MSKKELHVEAIDDFLIALNSVNEKLERLESFKMVKKLSNNEITKDFSIITNLCSFPNALSDKLEERLEELFDRLRQIVAITIGKDNDVNSEKFLSQIDDVIEDYHTKRIAINKHLNNKAI